VKKTALIFFQLLLPSQVKTNFIQSLSTRYNSNKGFQTTSMNRLPIAEITVCYIGQTCTSLKLCNNFDTLSSYE